MKKMIRLFPSARPFRISPSLREIGSFTLPVLFEQVTIATTAVISTMLVAHVSPAAISGVNLMESLNYLIQQIFLSLEIGATVVIAQYCGRNNLKSASEASVQALLTSLGIALLISALMLIFPDTVLGIVLGGAEAAVFAAAKTYFICTVISFPFLSIYVIAAASLRGSGNPRLSVISVFVTNVSYALLGLILTKWAGLGVLGVGIAMILARLLGAAAGLLLMKRGNGTLAIERWIPKKIDWTIQRSILLIGIPSCIENLLFQTGRLITQTYTIPLGTSAIATNALSNTIAGFYNIPGNTAGSIAIPIVGKYLGMRNKKDAWRSSGEILILSAVSLGLLSLILYIFAYPVARMFTDDAAIIEGIVLVSRSNYLVTPVIWTMSFVAPAVLRASGDVKYTTAVAMLSMFLFRITIGYLLAIVMGFGVIGIWAGMYADWLVRGILFGIRYFRRKWLDRTLIRDSAEG